MEFCVFDESYVERLRAGDFRTQEHFAAYFTELIKIKLRSRVRRPEDIEDIRQETFSRVLRTLRTQQGLRNPEKLGAYVNSTCNNVLLEYYRAPAHESPVEDEEQVQEYPDASSGVLDHLVSREVQAQVQQVLEHLSERDRRLIREVLLQERSKDEVCEEIGVNRDYLRVLLHRALKSFKEEYLERTSQPAGTMYRR
ncbi:RNA polymerase sigma-70 factor, ECF family [Acidisarcina polymorpha]|uniref:RNA polymerase sigma-70 factor, ECF family n=1 Tax=Acidisarcina polymorpha TaxID=2211140 RepID=A0A2Z5G7B4_9BACT|nr:sigma-70 family RNA polymerase sigma factor [Acidisarcina polymorpha]AXC14697.1 RNA polymerase sigma-70 factor, ECF family [Acidisarcina polymorpha]